MKVVIRYRILPEDPGDDTDLARLETLEATGEGADYPAAKAAAAGAVPDDAQITSIRIA
jgi:hypothetical protein